MKVLVAGGDGFIGTHLCRELLDRDHDVTVLARSPEDADLPSGVETARGDVTAYDSIAGAVEGHDAVVNLVALSPLFKPDGGDETHFRVHLGGTENLVRAAEEGGVARFVQMSALGADPDGPTAFLRAKGRAEAVVRESPLDWRIVRPSVVFGDGGEFVPFTKKLALPYVTPLPGGGNTRFQPIWVEDVAPMLADCVEDDDREGEAYELAGPEKLTLAEVARLAHRAAGRPVNVVPIPMSVAGVGLKLADKLPKAPMGADQYRSLQSDNTTDDNAVGAFGVSEGDLRTLAGYLGVR